jgi:hypothetical protein
MAAKALQQLNKAQFLFNVCIGCVEIPSREIDREGVDNSPQIESPISLDLQATR